MRLNRTVSRSRPPFCSTVTSAKFCRRELLVAPTRMCAVWPFEALVAPIEHARLPLERGRDGAREPEPVDVERQVARHDDLARHLDAMLRRVRHLDVGG